MNKIASAAIISGLLLAGCQAGGEKCAKSGWVSLFDGKTLDGWKASENKQSFKVENGMIMVNGGWSHLFYTGPVGNADFTNFEFKADVMTMPGANSGLFFHTAYQETDWPKQGFEVQVNNTYKPDPRKTGSLYGVVDVNVAPAKDNEWFTEHIIVKGKQVTIKVNDKVVVDYTEPLDAQRKLSHGTFALQCHDPKSRVCFKNIMVKPLP